MRPSITLSADLARQHELIDAAIAVNEAPTLEEAFQVVADAGLGLLGADRLSIVVWNEDVSGGIVRAAAGEAVETLGHSLPGDSQSMEALLTGEPVVGPPVTDGLAPAFQEAISSMVTVVRVPLVTESCRATFNASWRTVLDPAEAAEAGDVLHTLTRLTSIAERSLREREQQHLDFVLEGVADGVVLSSPTRVLLNAAARQMLGLAPGAEARQWLEGHLLAGDLHRAARRVVRVNESHLLRHDGLDQHVAGRRRTLVEDADLVGRLAPYLQSRVGVFQVERHRRTAG